MNLRKSYAKLIFSIGLIISVLILSISPLNSEEYTPLDDMKSLFSDILLIINYNNPHYQSIDFLKEIYSPVFTNIIFYGEASHPEVHLISHHKGWWGHEVLKDAMIRYPGYSGYLCLQDDCFLNYWNFGIVFCKDLKQKEIMAYADAKGVMIYDLQYHLPLEYKVMNELSVSS
jgi:hypothetical protein